MWIDLCDENCIAKCIVVSSEKNPKRVDFFKPDFQRTYLQTTETHTLRWRYRIAKTREPSGLFPVPKCIFVSNKNYPAKWSECFFARQWKYQTTSEMPIKRDKFSLQFETLVRDALPPRYFKQNNGNTPMERYRKEER